MNKQTRIENGVLGVSIFVGCALLSQSALACPPCPDGLVESSVTQSLTYGQILNFPDGGSAGFVGGIAGYGPNDPSSLHVDVWDAWCVAAFTSDFTCYVENSVGDGHPGGEGVQTQCQTTTPAQNPNAVAFAMYCSEPVQ